jgi:hypothetical protein
MQPDSSTSNRLLGIVAAIEVDVAAKAMPYETTEITRESL